MAYLSGDFGREIEALLERLRGLVGSPPLKLRLDADRRKVALLGDTLHVPARYEDHWRRFHTVPTDLAREAAYALKHRHSPPGSEVECVTFAETFVRDHVLGG